MMYWFHHGAYLPERDSWPNFVRQRSVSCYVIDLSMAEAARNLKGCQCWFVLRYGAGVHRFLAGYTGCAAHHHWFAFVIGGERGVSTCRAVVTRMFPG